MAELSAESAHEVLIVAEIATLLLQQVNAEQNKTKKKKKNKKKKNTTKHKTTLPNPRSSYARSVTQPRSTTQQTKKKIIKSHNQQEKNEIAVRKLKLKTQYQQNKKTSNHEDEIQQSKPTNPQIIIQKPNSFKSINAPKI